MQSDRLETIRRHLLTAGRATLAEISELTKASAATVRRDFAELEQRGLAERVHGGIRLAETSLSETAFEQRAVVNQSAKRAIAAAALSLMRPSKTYFLDAGTTVLQLARLLRPTRIPFHITTNGFPIAQALLGAEELRLSILGGRIRGGNLSVVGPHAQAMLARLSFDGLFLGAGAVREDGTIWGVDEDEASLNSLMIAQAEKVFLLADVSKFGARAPQAVGRIGPNTQVVTNAGISADWAGRIEAAGATLRIAEPLSPTQ